MEVIALPLDSTFMIYWERARFQGSLWDALASLMILSRNFEVKCISHTMHFRGEAYAASSVASNGSADTLVGDVLVAIYYNSAETSNPNSDCIEALCLSYVLIFHLLRFIRFCY
jgi:hypothetical protein